MRMVMVSSLMLALALSGCSGRSGSGGDSSTAVIRGFDASMNCEQLKNTYVRNNATIGGLFEEQLATDSRNPLVTASIVLGGVGVMVAMQNRNRELQGEIRNAVQRNRQVETYSLEKNCPPLAPTMDAVAAELSEKEATQVAAWEAERAAQEKLDQSFKRNDEP